MDRLIFQNSNKYIKQTINFNILMKRNTLKLLFLFTIISTLSACTLDTVTYKGVKNFKLQEVKGKKVSISCDLVLDNPNRHTFKIRPSFFDFYINEKHLGRAHLDGKVKILKQQENTVNVPITIELLDGTLPILIGATLKKTTNIRLVGTAKGAIFIFGAKRKIDVSKEVSLRDLKLNNLPLFKK